MMQMTDSISNAGRSGVSFAHANSANLPGGRSTLDSLQLSPRHDEALQTVDTSQVSRGRASEMVTKDRPRPAPRPSPDLAHEVDQVAFNAKWREEQIAARAEQRAARRQAFIAKRSEGKDITAHRKFNHSVRR